MFGVQQVHGQLHVVCAPFGVNMFLWCICAVCTPAGEFELMFAK